MAVLVPPSSAQSLAAALASCRPTTEQPLGLGGGPRDGRRGARGGTTCVRLRVCRRVDVPAGRMRPSSAPPVQRWRNPAPRRTAPASGRWPRVAPAVVFGMPRARVGLQRPGGRRGAAARPSGAARIHEGLPSAAFDPEGTKGLFRPRTRTVRDHSDERLEANRSRVTPTAGSLLTSDCRHRASQSISVTIRVTGPGRVNVTRATAWLSTCSRKSAAATPPILAGYTMPVASLGSASTLIPAMLTSATTGAGRGMADCDDHRFEGSGMDDRPLHSDRGCQATDCRKLFRTGRILLFGVNVAGEPTSEPSAT